MGKLMLDKILMHAITCPDKIAIHTPAGTITYGELEQRVKRTAAYLDQKQICPGDRVMVQAGANLHYVVIYLAIHYLGAVAVPVDRNATMETVLLMKNELSIAKFLTESNTFLNLDFVLSSKEAYENDSIISKEAFKTESLDAISDILFTTGTTGRSKGVVLSHRAVSGSIANVINGTGMTSEDTLLIPVPLNHSFGLRELRTILAIGGTAVLQNGFAFAKVLQNNIKQFSCTCMTCVPAAIRVLYQQSKGHLYEILGTLRYMEFCTAPLDLEMKQILLEQLPNTTLLNSYGSTESAGAVYLDFSKKRDKLLSIGKAVSGVQVKIVDDFKRPIPHSSRDCSGRLAILGEMNMSCYWNAPELTDEILENGWVYTNDIAYIDDDGYIFLLGRANDVINVGGKKVSPVELENAAILYPGVRECCCISAEDPKKILGNIPILFVVSDTSVKKTQLKDFLSEKLESYKLPADIIQIENIPKNYMGKTDRNILKKQYMDSMNS